MVTSWKSLRNLTLSVSSTVSFQSSLQTTHISSGVIAGDNTFTTIYLAYSGEKKKLIKKIFIFKQYDIMKQIVSL